MKNLHVESWSQLMATVVFDCSCGHEGASTTLMGPPIETAFETSIACVKCEQWTKVRMKLSLDRTMIELVAPKEV